MTAYPANLLDERVRDAFPVLKDVVYLNTGTYGIMPGAALAEFQRVQGEFEWRGGASDGTCHRKTEETRKRIAGLVGAKPEEIAFNRNATDGINFVLAGIDWKPGDEVITTVQEHEAMDHPLMYLHNTKGLVIKEVEVSPKAEVMLAELDAVVTDRTRLVAMSLVSCESGTRLPGKAISQWAAERNILCLFDGAQASGAIPVNMQELGCDFYASNGHKWLCGPKGTGFFYGRTEKLGLLSPAHVGAGSLSKYDFAEGIAEVPPTGQRFEFGTRAWGLTAGLGYSLDWFESLGWKAVYAHIASLSSYLKDCILERPYLTLTTPESFEESSGLTSFVIKGHMARDVQRELHEKGKIITRVIPHYNSMRLSTAHFNNPADIDRIMSSIDEICRQ